jgi:hypothetical protein
MLSVGRRIVSVNVAVPVLLPESVTLNVIGNVPNWIGVPLKTPAGLKLMPDGNAPVSDHVYPLPVPPVATNVKALYATPSVPFGNDTGLLIVTAAELIVSVNVTAAELLPESVTLNVIGNAPAELGVPPNTPPALKIIPAGNAPVSDHTYPLPVPPVAVNVTGP